MSKNSMKEVTIKPAINGWIVRVGCLTAVAISKEAMLSEIGRYIGDPNGVEAEYAKNALNQGTYTPDGDGEASRAESGTARLVAQDDSSEGDCQIETATD